MLAHTMNRKNFLKKTAIAVGAGAVGLLLPSKSRADSTIIAVNGLNTIQMSNSTWGRPVTLPSGWNKIRVGVICSAADSGIVSNPSLAIGFCHGTVNMMGDSSTAHFVGAFTNNTSPTNWVQQSTGYSNIQIYPVVNVGGTQTAGTIFATDMRVAYTLHSASYYSQVFFLDVTKGSPNYTLNVFSVAAANPASVSVATFISNLPLVSPSISSHSFFGAQTVPVNEATNGLLDTVNVWWNRVDYAFNLGAVGVAILA